MVEIKFEYRDVYWAIHLPELPKVGDQISIVCSHCEPLGRFWVAKREPCNGHYIASLTRLGDPKGGMCLIAEKTSPPESH